MSREERLSESWFGMHATHVRDLANKVSTTTGLSVILENNVSNYVSRAVTNDFEELSSKYIERDNDLAKWDYSMKWTV